MADPRPAIGRRSERLVRFLCLVADEAEGPLSKDGFFEEVSAAAGHLAGEWSVETVRRVLDEMCRFGVLCRGRDGYRVTDCGRGWLEGVLPPDPWARVEREARDVG